jgi:hypothetical protein
MTNNMAKPPSKIQRQAYDFRTECVLQLQYFFRLNHQAPLALYFDGGLKILFLAHLLHLNKIPFYFVAPFHSILDRFLAPMLSFCHDYGVEVQKVAFDIEAFFSGQFDLEQTVQATGIVDLLDIAALETLSLRKKERPSSLVLSDFMIFSKGFPVLRRNELGLMIQNSGRSSLFEKAFFNMEQKGCPMFFQQTPELLHSIFYDPRLRENFLNLRNDSVEDRELEEAFLGRYGYWSSSAGTQLFEGFEHSVKKMQEKLRALTNSNENSVQWVAYFDYLAQRGL